MIKVRNAIKRFGAIEAVAGVDLDVADGECFGLLGPNGAGKTSLVRMIIGASPLTGGSIWVDGKDITMAAREIKSRLAVVPQEENLDPDLNVLENLTTFARYFDIPKADARRRALDLLELFELQGRQKAKVRELSGGMRRRLLIARSLINEPKLLILDEPTIGLDPQGKHLVWQRLLSMRQRGLTLLLCTQNMEEAGYLCDRLAIMNEGKIIDLGSPQELLGRHGGSQVLEARLRSDDRKSQVVLKLNQQGLEWQEVAGTFYMFEDGDQVLDDELRQEVAIVSQHVPTLEDVFLKLTGRSLRE